MILVLSLTKQSNCCAALNLYSLTALRNTICTFAYDWVQEAGSADTGKFDLLRTGCLLLDFLHRKKSFLDGSE